MQHARRRRPRDPVPPAVIPAARERAIAVAADADPRTVRRWLLGLPVRGSVGDRIARAVASLGVEVAR